MHERERERERERESWNPVWESVFSTYEWGKYPEIGVVRFVARNFYQAPDRSKIRILDLGSGPGAHTWYLAREGFSVSSIDGSSTAIARLRKRLESEGLVADAHVADISSLPWPDNTFDATIDSECLTCNPAEATLRILSEVHRVLKPGGRFFSITLAPGTWGCETALSAPGHYVEAVQEGPLAGKGGIRITTEDDITQLYGTHFAIESVDYVSRTQNGRTCEVNEWLVLCRKD